MNHIVDFYCRMSDKQGWFHGNHIKIENNFLREHMISRFGIMPRTTYVDENIIILMEAGWSDAIYIG